MTLVQKEPKAIKLGKLGDYSAMQGPAPDGFHVPLNTEWQAVYNIWTALGGGSNDGTNFGIALKLPFAGVRNQNNAGVYEQGTFGSYWSSSSYNANNAYYLDIRSSVLNPQNYFLCAVGFSIRCFKNTPTTPTSSWTKLYGTSIESGGIFWSSTDGLISLSSDGQTWLTIADKNLGATAVWNNGDTLSQTNCGYYYQRGNNYGFPRTGSVTTSSTQVDASSYGPGNYYSSSTFITYTPRDTSNNANLRGGVTGAQPLSIKKVYLGSTQVRPKVYPYLCFTANTAGSTVQLTTVGTPTSVTLETSSDGETRNNYTIGNTITLSNIGDKIYFRNTSTTNTAFSTSGSYYYKFSMSGSIAGSGDTNYLINKNSTTTVPAYCFNYLFYNCTQLTTAPELPATTIGNACYYNMFRGCTQLTTAPDLPATKIKWSSYAAMFYGCNNLTTAGAISATTLDDYCCNDMFCNCSKLTTIPKLYATTLKSYCYKGMFEGCSLIKLSTTQAGEYQTPYRIPTTGTGTTASNALSDMFKNTGGPIAGSPLYGTPAINTTYYTSNTVV